MSIALLCAACQSGPKEQIGAAGGPDSAPPCKGVGAGDNTNDCEITVKVTQTGSKCSVDVSDDLRTVVFAANASDKWILWRIQGNVEGYGFTEDGIEFKPGVDPFGNFKPKVRTQNGQVFKIKNKNGWYGNGDYPYGIKVENTRAKIACEKDPTIRNR
jgi:hypothetical protein